MMKGMGSWREYKAASLRINSKESVAVAFSTAFSSEWSFKFQVSLTSLRVIPASSRRSLSESQASRIIWRCAGFCSNAFPIFNEAPPALAATRNALPATSPVKSFNNPDRERSPESSASEISSGPSASCFAVWVLCLRLARDFLGFRLSAIKIYL